ncbi:NADP-dependent oxidoreductase domain-containing protein [Lanmaoa asiatica]|nr:NADP-dependent oxidoreductase domain-containing protein [Lanmaoa asiatica]
MPATMSVTLNTGAIMPTVGLGTWKSQPGQVEHAVEFALKNGYTHIDTATAYDNEKEVGQGIKASGVPREQIFLTTKLFNDTHKDTQKALDYSLKQLDTPYIDLCECIVDHPSSSTEIRLPFNDIGLMHWPAPMTRDSSGKLTPDRSHDWLDTWKSMEDVYFANRDKLKAIGISNFSVEYLERLLNVARVVPAVNQIELHPSCPQKDVVDYCLKKGIIITAYSPLGSDNSPLLKNPVVGKIAGKYGVQPANILISLHANKPFHTVLPKSVTNSRILSNGRIVDLTEEDIAELDAIDKTHHFRACHPSWTGWGGLGFPDCK